MTARLTDENDSDSASEELHLSDELATALRAVMIARDRLTTENPQSASYQAVLTGYLRAAVHHLALLAVAQAQRSESLAAEVAELRARIEAQRPLVH